jgi:hypothetical protein
MTISLDKLAELAAAPHTEPWWSEAELREGVRHFDSEPAFIAACDPGTVHKLIEVAQKAQEWARNVRPQGNSEHALADAIKALESP